MPKRFVYFYFMKNAPEKIGDAVPKHIEYWKGLNLPDYLGGPFADRSGGMITFSADSIEAASEIAGGDPFVMLDLLENRWVKEWIAE